MRIVLIALLAIALWGKSIEAEYKVEYGVFGRVAKSIAKLDQNQTNYKIEIVAQATGFAKVLTGNRKEIYESSGKVVNGKLVPIHFVKKRSRRGKVSIKFFDFDHGRKKVYVHKEIYKNGKLIAKSKPSALPYYAKNDLLTLYFNIIDTLRSKSGPQLFHAVGADRKTGRVDIIIPTGKELEKLQHLLKEEGFYFIAIIHQKIFASKDGKLFIVAGKDGIAKKAVLKDVIMFGDIVGKLVRKQVRE